MSLYTREEICDGCENANWHSCDRCIAVPRFCHCNNDDEPYFCTGRCDGYTQKKTKMESIPGDEETFNNSLGW